MFALLPVSYGYVLAISLLATVAHVRLFMIGHDCAHQSYLPRKGWQNKALGNFIGVLTNTPLNYWGSQHLMHHQTVGNLPRWLHWATGNIGYHHLHHLNPKIPNYKLAACHYSDPMLQEGKSITFWESFRLANLALWDESARRLISFAEFDRTGEPTR
jgi:fatty acid desaturase